MTLPAMCCRQDALVVSQRRITMLSSRRATLCARPGITWKLFAQNFPPRFTHSSCLQHVHVETETKRTMWFHWQTGKKNQWKPHIKLPEASLGTGLRHPVTFHHKTLKMGHCLWHVLSSLATLHLTRSKTKKEKKHLNHQIRSIWLHIQLQLFSLRLL